MTAAEFKGLKKGSRVYWRGDAADGGRAPPRLLNSEAATARIGPSRRSLALRCRSRHCCTTAAIGG